MLELELGRKFGDSDVSRTLERTHGVFEIAARGPNDIDVHGSASGTGARQPVLLKGPLDEDRANARPAENEYCLSRGMLNDQPPPRDESGVVHIDVRMRVESATED